MVKRLNEAFSDEDHKSLLEQKEKEGKQIGRKISWHDYLLHISGVRKLE